MFKKFFKYWEIVAVFAVAAFGSFYLGYINGVNQPKEIIVRGITNVGDEDVTADFGIFWQALNKIKSEHVDGEKVADKDLIYGAIGGMVNALDDPNTVFFPPEDGKKFEEDVSGSFGGIGAEIGIRDDQLIIVAPLKDSPAEKAGLRAKDKILAVDKKPSSGLSVNDGVKTIRGEIGTDVTLTILRNGWEKPRDFVITRQEIKVPTLDWDLKGDGYMHFKLYSFNENAPYLFYRAAAETLFANAKGIVLDLRNDPGGFLEVAVNLAGWYLDRGDIVTIEKFRSGDERVFRANGNGALKNIPTVILVNGGSASASEIMAGALRDHLGVKLIGEKTFGKGSVQELFRLKDDSSLKVTVANWVTPNGTVIDKKGLDPDIEVKFTEKDAELGRDPQLDKAIEVLRELTK